MGRMGASQDPLSWPKHILRIRMHTQYRAGMVWADDEQKPVGSVSSARGGFEEGEGACEEGRGICFRHWQHSRTQYLSLTTFPGYPCQVLIGKDSAGYCGKEGTEVGQLILLVSLPATVLQAAPRNGTGFFACP